MNNEEKILDLLEEMYAQLSSKMDNIHKELKAEIGELRTEVKELRTDVNQLKADVRELKADVSQLKTEMKEVKAEIKGMKLEIKEMKYDIQGLKQSQVKMQERLDSVYEQTVQLTEFRTEITMKVDSLIEDNRHIHAILEDHEASIGMIKRHMIS